MEGIRYNKSVKKVLLVAVLTLASVLAFVLYHLIVSPKTTIYGVGDSDNVNVTVSVDAPLYGPPQISKVGPLSGPIVGGTRLTILGNNLDPVDEVNLGGGFECAPITHISNTELTCVMPPHVEGYVNVTVSSPSYGAATKGNAYRYLADAPKPPNTNGGGPAVPNTGLFRLGKHIITLYDLLTLLAVVVLWAVAVWLIIWKRPRRHEANKKA
jgi:hypothetical protein